MQAKAAVTVHRSRDEVQRLWQEHDHGVGDDATVTFVDAPGDRGTEIHVDLGRTRLIDKVVASPALTRTKDALRRFKQQVETGEVPRSEGTPEGESAGRKFKQRPAQPLEGAGAR